MKPLQKQQPFTYLSITLLGWLLCLSPTPICGQQTPRETNPSRISLAASFNYLYSTHTTRFRGPGLTAEYALTPQITTGLGTAYIYCPFHPDNGYNLRELKFIPVYGSFRYRWHPGKTWEPYALMRLGISFMHYDQQLQDGQAPYHPVTTQGFYTYGAVGTTYRISPKIRLLIDAGLIGYKMSFNDLDINPHGINGNLGILIHI